jgi:hypothetical protein
MVSGKPINFFAEIEGRCDDSAEGRSNRDSSKGTGQSGI